MQELWLKMLYSHVYYYNCVQVIIRGGGHLIPYDQPERSFNLIQLFISDEIKKFNVNEY